jgi:hypothetical protein
MKTSAGATFILVTARRVARADFDGTLRSAESAARPAGASAAEAVRAALALGGKAARETWVLDASLWTQRVNLGAAQVAGLTPEQLGRALSFEVEPFSGIPVTGSATGFHEAGDGMFDVVQMPHAECDAIARAVASAGGQLAGIAHPGVAPEDEEALLEWWPHQVARTAGGPVVTPPVPEPWPHRFLAAGMALEVAAIVFLLVIAGWNGGQRKTYERCIAEFAAATRELDAANTQNEVLRAELATFEKQDIQREQIQARRGSLLALMNALAATCGEEVVVRALAAEGPSSIVVSGHSLEASAVDEMSIVLTQSLRAAGWTAQPRSKTGLRNLSTGGPWEFSLVLMHEEAARAQAVQLSQHTRE